MRDRLLSGGLLVIRVGLGAMMMVHGVPKLMGGTRMWAKLGANMAHLGVDFAPTFWGFMAGYAEAVGGLFLLLGLATRVHGALLAFTMLVATAMHMANGDGLSGSAHAIEDGVVFFGLVLTGAGAFSLDALWMNQRQSKS